MINVHFKQFIAKRGIAFACENYGTVEKFAKQGKSSQKCLRKKSFYLDNV